MGCLHKCLVVSIWIVVCVNVLWFVYIWVVVCINALWFVYGWWFEYLLWFEYLFVVCANHKQNICWWFAHELRL